MDLVLGVSGRARSGKSEFTKIAVNEFGAKQVSFAGPLKEEVAEFLTQHDVCWERRHLYGEVNDKEATLRINTEGLVGTLEGEYFINFFAPDTTNVPKSVSFTPRALMQMWGTEYRRSLDDNYWVTKALASCTEGFCVIDDCRFVNEAEGILRTGGMLIRVERPVRPGMSNPTHPSETGLDNWDVWDHILVNAKSLQEYQAVVRGVLREVTS